jgi:predicted transporter
MLYKSLIIGVVMSIGLFAVKSGAGIGYRLARQQRWIGKIVVLLLFTGAYAMLFGLVAVLLHLLDPVRHLKAVQTFMQSGMVIHVILAGVMTIWGVVLLKRTTIEETPSRGWLLLAAPCPVCAAMILFSAALLVSLFPDQLLPVISGLYAVFVLISLLTIVVVGLYYKSRARRGPEFFLGGVMLLVAAYFILSVTVMPQFADLNKVYRLAGYASDLPGQDLSMVLPMAAITIAAFIFGWGVTYKKIHTILYKKQRGSFS